MVDPMLLARLFRSRALLLLAPAALLCGGLAPAAAQQQTGGPRLKVEPPLLEFGTMKQHETREATITLTNVGDGILKIRDLRTDCGCTVANTPTDQLAPGESTTLQVQFNSKEFEGDKAQYVRIFTNDPLYPSYELPVKAFVHVPIMCTPLDRKLGFQRVRAGREDVQQAWLTSLDTETLELEPVRYNEDLFEVWVEPASDDPRQKVVSVKLRPDAALGEHREFVRLRTNVPEMPTVDLEVYAQVIAELEAYPSEVNFRLVQRNRTLRYNVRVRASDRDVEFKVTGAEIDLPGFEVKVEETIPNVETHVRITGQPLPVTDERAIAARGRLQGTLTIHTDHPRFPVLKVDVKYRLKM
jgi:hypothetical protein